MALDVSIRAGVKTQDGASGLRVQRSKSLVPPSIVELSSNRVILSWRATIGQCSIRTEVPEGSTDSQEWANLEEDTGQPRGAKPAVRASAVEVFEVDHVELQTCRGCPRCLHGEEYDEETDEEVMEHRCGLGCWRPVYQGPGCRCEIDLGRGNALHYFRLLVRAKLPPPEQRGYMRPKNASLIGFEAGKDQAHEELGVDRGGGRFEHMSSSNQTSPHRWRRRRRGQQQTGVGVASLSDSDEATHLDGIGGNSREDGSDVIPSRGRETGEVIQGGESTALPGDRVQWFASDSVFVDSRPPPVTLHGIGTALVLTWPGVAGLSGAEEVSYILEQWSHAAACTISPPSKAIEHRVAVAAADGGNTEGEPDQTNPFQRTTRQRQRRRHHPHHPAPPTQVEAKEAFSVGTRCWFMPTRLQPGKRYWYRLRLIHEGGKGVGGPWVSYLTYVTPPRCVEVGSRGLVLALPRAIDEAVPPASMNGLSRGAAEGGHAFPKNSSGDEPQQAEHSSATREDGGGNIVREDGQDLNDGQADGEGRREQENCEGGPETPMVWYTLEGLTRTSGWSVLYRGPAPEVIVGGLRPNTLVKFRVGIDVDITELRHRSLGLLGSLELETSSPTGVPTTADAFSNPVGDQASPVDANVCGLPSPTRTPSRQRSFSPHRSVVVRPALRLCSAAGYSYSKTDPVGKGGSAANTEQVRQPWSPVTSPAVSMMKREGFAVHDVTATVGGGFYLERPLLSWGRFQGHRGGAVWESGTNRAGDAGDRPQCREYSAVGEFSTASMPPRFASFVVGGVPQVKLWWAQPRSDTGFTTPPAQIRPATAPSSSSPHNTFVDHRQKHHHAPAKGLPSSPTRDRPSTAADVGERRLVAGGDASTGILPPGHQKPAFFTLDVLQPPEADEGGTAARLIHPGPELWTDLARSSSPASSSGVSSLPKLAPSTAYCVRLSTRTTTAQPETAVEAVVVTAPPAPALEPEPATAEDDEASPETTTAREGSGVVGAVTLKAVWNTGIDASFLPVGVEPPPVSFALEMAHSSQAGPPTHGAGGTATKVARNVASGQNAPPAFRFLSARNAAPANSSSPTNAADPSCTAQEIPVRKDVGSGQCWTLGSSSWGKPKMRGDGFRVVWTGEAASAEGGLMEALTPPLPPGMRFAIRVRAECCFGVAVSAATVYQTAVVAPLPPKGLRAILATHESRAGNTSRCVRLLWDPFYPGHGKNVVTSFTVQARRPRHPSRDQALQDVNHPRPPPILGHPWKDLCSCVEIGCLDPTTLGVPHIIAEYRVRAEGPGGKGPWSDSLPVDMVVPVVEGADNLFDIMPSGDVKGGGGGGSVAVSSVTCVSEDKGTTSPRQPMNFFRPGTRVRDPLTGEARRLWTKQRPLRVSPPPLAVAALVRPGAVVTAKTIAAAEHKHRRTGGSNQLLWGALASPRAARGCRIAATTTPSGTAPAEETQVPALTDDINDGISSGRGKVHGGNCEKRRETMPEGEALAPTSHGWGEVEAEVAVPRYLAMMLREELDVSCRLGCHATGRRDGRMEDSEGCGAREAEGGDGASLGLLGTDELRRRNPDFPVVAWVAHSPGLDDQTQGDRGGRSQEETHSQHRHQNKRRSWRRRRRRPATTPGVDRRTTQNDRLVGDVLLAAAPQRHQQQQRQPQRQRQRQRQPQQVRSRSKSPERSHRSHRRPGGGDNDGARGGTGRRKGGQGAGGLDCYRDPNSEKTAANRGGSASTRHRKDGSPDREEDGKGNDGGRSGLGEGSDYRGGNTCPGGG